MRSAIQNMMALLQSELTGVPVSQKVRDALQDEKQLCDLYTVSKHHDLAHMVAAALQNNQLLPETTIGQNFRKQMLTAVYRYESQQHSFTEICAVLESENIPYVPLKGAVIRAYYPEPWLRTSCDIDILIQETDLPRAVQALERCGYQAEKKKAYHDISLHTPSGIHLELHFSIQEAMENIDRVLVNAWEYTEPDGDGCRRKFSAAFFMFHQIAHASYHFLRGGCGIRLFLDIYLLEQKLPYDADSLAALLKRSGLEKFFAQIQQLLAVWFENASPDTVTQKTEEYIIAGGIYGSRENHASVQQVSAGGKGRAIWRRIFLPYDSLKLSYPKLAKHRWLLPYYTIVRLFRVLFTGRVRHGVQELKTNASVQADARADTAALLEALGLLSPEA